MSFLKKKNYIGIIQYIKQNFPHSALLKIEKNLLHRLQNFRTFQMPFYICFFFKIRISFISKWQKMIKIGCVAYKKSQKLMFFWDNPCTCINVNL